MGYTTDGGGSVWGGVLAAILIGAIATIAVAAISIAMAYPIKWAWNYTMPEIFGLIEIHAGQAWCLSFLSGCLIKSSLKCKS